VIDDKRITIEDFGRMLEAYEGWRFKFQILDPYDNDGRSGRGDGL
jgi:hypothetical protein